MWTKTDIMAEVFRISRALLVNNTTMDKEMVVHDKVNLEQTHNYLRFIQIPNGRSMEITIIRLLG